MKIYGFRKRGFGVAAFRALYVFFELMIVFVLARILSVEDFGVFTFIYAIVKISTIPAQAGLPTLLTREIPRSVALGGYGEVKGIISWSNKFALVSSCLIGVIAVSLIYFLDFFAYGTVALYFATAVLVPVFALSNVRGGAIRGLDKVVLSQVPESLIRPTVFLVITLLSYFYFKKELGASDAIMCFFIASSISAIVGSWMLYKELPQAVKKAPAVYYRKKWLLSIVPLSLLSGMQIVNGQIGIIYLGMASSFSDVGVYKVVFQVGQVVMFALTVVTLTVSPTISRLYAEKDNKQIQSLINKCCLITFSFSIIALLLFVVFGKVFLTYFFGEDYSAGYYAGIILCFSQVINSLTGPAAALLNMTGKDKFTIKALFCSLVVSLLGHFLLIDNYGVLGAALAFSLSMLVLNIMLYIYSWRVLKVKCLPWLFGSDR